MAKSNNTFEGVTGFIIIIIAFLVACAPWVLWIIGGIIVLVIIGWIGDLSNSSKNSNKHAYSLLSNNSSENISDLYYKGLNYLDSQAYQNAIECFSKILNKGNLAIIAPVPTDDIYVLRGIAYSNLGMNKDAKDDFSKAISMFSYDNSTAHLERGKIYLREKNYENAIIDFNKAIKMNFYGNGDDFFYRGLAYIQLGEKEKAIKDISKALELAPKENSEIRQKCSQILAKLKPNNKSIEKISKTKNKKVNLKTCTRNSILTLDGFDQQKADKFVSLRKLGIMWYDIDSFVSEFEIQPHHMIMIQDRIIFPPKPQSKLGNRRIDI